jgi:hypothetical protein
LAYPRTLAHVRAAVVAVLAWHYSQQDLPNHWQMLALLVGVLLFLPLILTNTSWGYRIFTGKVE